MKEGEGKLKSLYGTLVKDGYELPSEYSAFEKDMSDQTKLNSLYDNLVEDGYELPDDKDVFRLDMFGEAVKKKVGTGDLSATSVSETPFVDSNTFVPDNTQSFAQTDEYGNPVPGKNPATPELHQQFLQEQIANGSITTEQAQQEWELANPELAALSQIPGTAQERLHQPGFPGSNPASSQVLGEAQAVGDAGLVEDKTNTNPLPEGADYWAANGTPMKVLADGSSRDARISDDILENIKRGSSNAFDQIISGAAGTIGAGASIAADALDNGIMTGAVSIPFPEGAAALRKITEVTNTIAENIGKGVANKPILNNTEQIQDLKSAVAYVSGNMAQTGSQIAAHIATGGATAFVQEIGAAYNESVQKIADKYGISASEVIERNLDAPYLAVAAGTLNGGLEYIQPKAAKNILAAVSTPKALKQIFIDAGKEFAKGAGTEYLTEFGQSLNSQFAVNLSAEDKITVKAIQDAISSVDYSQANQEGIAASFGGGFSGAGASVASSYASLKKTATKLKNVAANVEQVQSIPAPIPTQPANPNQDFAAMEDSLKDVNADGYFDSNKPKITNAIAYIPDEINAVFDKIDQDIFLTVENMAAADKWANDSKRATLLNGSLSNEEKKATIDILNNFLSDIDTANENYKQAISDIESVQDDTERSAIVEQIKRAQQVANNYADPKYDIAVAELKQKLADYDANTTQQPIAEVLPTESIPAQAEVLSNTETAVAESIPTQTEQVEAVSPIGEETIAIPETTPLAKNSTTSKKNIAKKFTYLSEDGSISNKDISDSSGSGKSIELSIDPSNPDKAEASISSAANAAAIVSNSGDRLDKLFYNPGVASGVVENIETIRPVLFKKSGNGWVVDKKGIAYYGPPDGRADFIKEVALREGVAIPEVGSQVAVNDTEGNPIADAEIVAVSEDGATVQTDILEEAIPTELVEIKAPIQETPSEPISEIVSEETVVSEQTTEPATPLTGGLVKFEFADGVERVGTIVSQNEDGSVNIKGENGRNYPMVKVKAETLTPATVVDTLPTQAKPQADKFIDFTNKLKIDTKNTAQAFGLLPALYNAAIDVVQVSYLGGKQLVDAIGDAITYIKNNMPAGTVFDEGGFLSQVQSSYTQAEADARSDAFDSLAERKGLLEEKVFGSRTATPADLKNKGNALTKTIGFAGKVQEQIFGKLADVIGEKLSQAVGKGVVSDKAVIRKVTAAFSNVFRGLEVPSERMASAELMNGIAKNKAVADANQINRGLKDLLTDKTLSKEEQKVQRQESLRRIDQVLDPEFYAAKTEPEFFKYLEEQMGAADFATLTDTEKQGLYTEHTGHAAGFTPVTESDLTPQEKGVYDTIREIYDLVHDTNFAIGKIPFNTYARRKGGYVARMYGVYEIPSDIEGIVRESRRKMNLGMYSRSGDIDFWKITNKVQDPVYMATTRLYQTVANKAIFDYSKYIASQPNLVSNTPLPGFVELGDGYGDLSNKFVPQNIAEDFRGFFYLSKLTQDTYNNFKGYNNWSFRQFFKQAFTVYNPGVHLGNITGNNVFAFWAGIDPITLNIYAYKAMGEMKSYSATYQFLMEQGLLGTDLTKGDLKDSLRDFNNEFDEAADGGWEKIKALFASNKIKDFYGKVDDVYKFGAFSSLVSQGIEPTVAVNRVKNAFQNSQRVSKFADFVSKTPVLGNPFFRFASDLQRVIIAAATTRPLYLAAFGGLLHAVAEVAQYMSGESDEDREVREGRPGYAKLPLPEWMGGNIPLSYKFSKDTEVNLARYISPLFTYTGINPEDDSWADLLTRFSPIPVSSDFVSSDADKRLAAASKVVQDPVFAFVQLFGTDFRGRNPLDPETRGYKKSHITNEEKLGNAIQFLSRAYGTPYMSFGQDLYSATQGEPDYYGRTRTTPQAVMRFLGYKGEEFGGKQYQKVVKNKLQASKFAKKELDAACKLLIKRYQQGEITKEQYIKRSLPKFEAAAKAEVALNEAVMKALRYIQVREIKDVLHPKKKRR